MEIFKERASGVIEFMHWSAVPADFGGYYIHKPGFYNTLVGHAMTKDAAMEWLKESSGYNNSLLPKVNLKDVTITTVANYHDMAYGRKYHIHIICYHHDNKIIGRVQKKTMMDGTVNYLTSFDGKNTCCVGVSLTQMFKEAGYQLIFTPQELCDHRLKYIP